MIHQDAGRLQQQNCQGPGPLLLAAAPVVGPDKPPGGWEEDEDVRKEDRPPHEQLAAGEELQVLVDPILTEQVTKSQTAIRQRRTLQEDHTRWPQDGTNFALLGLH
jgi:hypothetical protein